MTNRYFTKQTFPFLSALAANNTREWFEAHQQDYENFVRAPALDFISDMGMRCPRSPSISARCRRRWAAH